MKDKKELSKVISALTAAVNELNSFVAEDNEDTLEPAFAEPAVEDQIEIANDIPEDADSEEEIEIVDDEDSDEDTDKEKTDEGLGDLLNPLAPVKTIGKIVGGIGNAVGSIGESKEECEDGDCDKETCDEGIGSAVLGGLAMGAASAVGNKVAGKIIGEEADDESIGKAAKEVASTITDYFRNNGNNSEKADTAQKIIDAIPEDLLDNVIDEFKDKFGNKEITDAADREFQRKGIDSSSYDTFGEMLDDFLNDPEKNKAGKKIVLAILAVIAIIEPTPVGEIIMAILALLPAKDFLKILFYISAPLPMILRKVIRKKYKENIDNTITEDFEEETEEDDEENDYYEDDGDVEVFFDDDEYVDVDECKESLTEAKIADFEDEFNFYVTPGLAEDVFYRDAYVLVEPKESANSGAEVIYVDADQMIYLYNEGTDRDEYSRFVHSDIDVESEIRHILQSQLDLAVDEIANVRIVKGKYYR